MSGKKKWVPIIAGVIFLALLPRVIALGGMTDILIFLFLYLILGQSFNILGGYTGLISLGHSVFLGVGALATRYVWIWGIPIPIALIAGGLAAAIVAVVIGFPTLRLRGAYFAMGTLALTMICYNLTTNIFVEASFIPEKYMADYSPLSRYDISLAVSIIATVFVYVLSNSRIGKGMIAIRENEDAAGSLGINTFRCKLTSLILSAFLAGAAGGVFAYYQTSYFIHDLFAPLWTFAPILVATVGGLGTVAGPVIGAIFYVGLRELFALTVGAPHIIIFGAIFIVVVLLMRGGLYGGLRRFHRFLTRS